MITFFNKQFLNIFYKYFIITVVSISYFMLIYSYVYIYIYTYIARHRLHKHVPAVDTPQKERLFPWGPLHDRCYALVR
jgi:hypothetical protein